MELMPISEVYRFVFRIETQCISHIDPVTVACGKTAIDRYQLKCPLLMRWLPKSQKADIVNLWIVKLWIVFCIGHK